MSAEANTALARRWFEEVWNQGKESTIDEILHSEAKAYGFPEPDAVLEGPESFKIVHSQFCRAFSHIHIDIDDVLAVDDRVAARWTCTMDHTGDAPGFPATGKKTTVGGASFMTFRDGKLVEGWNYMDLTKMRLQLQGH